MDATLETMPRHCVWQGMENIMSGEIQDSDVARMRSCADKGLHRHPPAGDRFQHLEHQSGYRAEEINMIKKAPRGGNA